MPASKSARRSQMATAQHYNFAAPNATRVIGWVKQFAITSSSRECKTALWNQRWQAESWCFGNCFDSRDVTS